MKKTFLLLTYGAVFWSGNTFASAGDHTLGQDSDAFINTQGALLASHTQAPQRGAYTFIQMECLHMEGCLHLETPETGRYAIYSESHQRKIGLFEIGRAQAQDEHHRALEWALDKGVHDDNVLPQIISFAFNSSASFHTLVFLLSPLCEPEMAPFQALDPALNPETRSFAPDDGGLSGHFFKARSIGLYSYNVNLPLQKGKISRYLVAYTLSREDAARMDAAYLERLSKKAD